MSDLISRQKAIDELFSMNSSEDRLFVDEIVHILENLPEAESPDYDEWCDGCKEFDNKKHCCPRWNKVIRNTIEEMKKNQAEPAYVEAKHIVEAYGKKYLYGTCGACGAPVIQNDKYCSECGTKLDWSDDE